MSRTFASQADLEEKAVSFVEPAPGAYAYPAQGDPNAGTMTFSGRITLWLGNREVQILQLGAGHTKGGTGRLTTRTHSASRL